MNQFLPANYINKPFWMRRKQKKSTLSTNCFFIVQLIIAKHHWCQVNCRSGKCTTFRPIAIIGPRPTRRHIVKFLRGSVWARLFCRPSDLRSEVGSPFGTRVRQTVFSCSRCYCQDFIAILAPDIRTLWEKTLLEKFEETRADNLFLITFQLNHIYKYFKRKNQIKFFY